MSLNIFELHVYDIHVKYMYNTYIYTKHLFIACMLHRIIFMRGLIFSFNFVI